MKKAFLFFSLLFTGVLFAFFSSNSIGQNLGEKEEFEGVGYEGEIRGNYKIIYLDGNPVMVREEKEDGYSILEENRYEEITLDEEGKRVKRIIREGGIEEVTLYYYTGSALTSVFTSRDGIVTKAVEYVDNASGLLSAVLSEATAIFNPAFYIYEKEGEMVKITAYNEDGFSPSGMTLDENGNWREEKDGTLRIYSESGVLLSVEDENSKTEFFYNPDGTLQMKRERSGEDEIVYYYSADGKEEKVEEYKGEIIEKSVEKVDDRFIETRYEEGRPFFKIYYDSDGKRVLRIENL